MFLNEGEMLKSIAMKFSDKNAPPEGTIEAHKNHIKRDGFVWYGKIGAPVSDKTCKKIMEESNPRVLLIQSGQKAFYWAKIIDICKSVPPMENVPVYYHYSVDKIHTWFKMIKIEKASLQDINCCKMASYGAPLIDVLHNSMGSMFIIEYNKSIKD